MRLGNNPAKASPQLNGYGRHRVIIPIYIPNLEGYFEHSLEVLRLCLDSLRLTARGKVNITIVSNGSAPEIVEELHRRYEEGWIDQLLLNQRNRGKVDAIVSAAKGAFEELITFSDCDVLFVPGWIQAVESIFEHFPECGFASPVPNPAQAWYNTSATLIGALARRELFASKVVPDKDLDRFAHSVNRETMFKPEHRQSQLIVRRGNAIACVGAGHFVFTTRNNIVRAIPPVPTLMAVSGNSEELCLDQPPDRLGFWRLATSRSYAYHIGNSPEPWCYQQYSDSWTERSSSQRALSPVRTNWEAKLPWAWRRMLTSQLSRTTVRRLLINLVRS